MPKRKPGLTLDEHRQAGAELKAMHQTLVKLIVQLGAAYPVTGPINRRVKKVQGALSELRCALDDQVFKDHPTRATTRVYYGQNRPEALEREATANDC